MIIGTAGHIDHGKTALVRALTGIETDRLKEEQERGISIDLGFAHFDVDGAEAAGVVDVPGHERFIRNMLAGVHGVDLVLLVVAADDGVMPQTEEHLDILHLLGVRHGLVAMTKVDLVDARRRAAVREEIEILLAGTTLEGAPIFEVSSVTGEGVPVLHAALRERVRALHKPEPNGCFRLPVDRAFSLHGHGLVVTGTAIAGAIEPEATVRILPGGKVARVRSVQVHGRAVDRAHYGQRVALNLGGVERADVGRGHVVCDPQLERATDRFDAWVELRPAARRPVANHTRVRVYAGTAEVLGKLIWLDGRAALPPQASAYAQLVLREPVVACGGDRFILRDQTARATIGGGGVLHPFARPHRRGDRRVGELTALHRAAGPAERVRALLALERALVVVPSDLAAAANLESEPLRAVCAADAEVRPLPDARQPEAYTSAEKWARLRAAVREALDRFHQAEPRQVGMEMESLRRALAADLSPKVFRALVAELEREQVVVRQESLLRLPSHRLGLDEREQRLAARLEAVLDAAGFTPPDVKQLAAALGVAEPQLAELLAQLERERRIVRVSPELAYAPAAIERAQALVRAHVAAQGTISAAQFRDLIDASRKFSIALLNYFDRTGFTLRVGDVRKLRRT
jgi:selenocysteine-specific elongation factor